MKKAAAKTKAASFSATDVLAQLEKLGSEGYRRILSNHGVEAPCFGVKIGDLKKIQKRVGKDYELALNLFKSGVYDARYLAGLIADEARMSARDLQRWADEATGPISGCTVPGIAAETPHGWELGLKWIESPVEKVAVAGWTTLTAITSIKPDSELDLAQLKKLLQRVQRTIHQQPDKVRYVMNGFVIGVGCFVSALSKNALEVAEKIGEVTVDMGNTACEVPFAPDYIRKVEKRGTIGKKRKSARC